MATKILDATSGYSSTFQLPNNDVIFRLYITGIATNSIVAFIQMSDYTNNLYLKIKGITGSGTTVKLQAKTNHPDDDFDDTGELYNNDFSGTHYLQNN
jgi:hypothetical protein